MKLSSGTAVSIVIAILLVAAIAFFAFSPKATAPSTTASSTPTGQNNVTYVCTEGSLHAAYGANLVTLTLANGQTITLPQVMSGSGIRYEQGSGTTNDIQFSSEGSNAFLTENGKMTYSNCIANSSTGTTVSGSKSFTDSSKTFSFMYPSFATLSGGGVGYTNEWMQNATTSGLLLAKVTVPQTFEPKTNFSDATFTVGTSPDPSAVAGCTTSAESGGSAPQKSTVTINGIAYTKFVTNDAGAGNYYETTSYRTIRNSQCYAIEYTIHSTNIDNYSPDQGITQFDQSKVQSVLDSMVQSFKFL